MLSYPAVADAQPRVTGGTTGRVRGWAKES